MSVTETRRIAENWIRLHQLPKDAPERNSFLWASARLNDLCRDEPEDAWQAIDLIRRSDSSDLILSNLAAGPVEDLLAKHGDAFIDRIEELAAKDREFRKLLGAVWRNEIAEDIWIRVKAIAGPTF
jgi:hypothetical protein